MPIKLSKNTKGSTGIPAVLTSTPVPPDAIAQDAPLIFLYRTWSSGGKAIPNSDGGYEWCDHEDEIIHMEPLRLSRNPPSEFYEGCDTVPAESEAYSADNAFLVVARYSDGGTFGTTYGYVHPIRVFANERDARDLAAKVEGGSADIGYTPWGGYFSSLGSVDVLELRVADS